VPETVYKRLAPVCVMPVMEGAAKARRGVAKRARERGKREERTRRADRFMWLKYSV
jgi:hypothetical protein